MVSAVSEETPSEHAEDEIRRQSIVEQLRKNGVHIDDNGKTLSTEERTSLPSQSSDFADDEASKVRAFFIAEKRISHSRAKETKLFSNSSSVKDTRRNNFGFLPFLRTISLC
ncbi:unnamed protein product [Strongylus vulgaris]|uniref:Uncharacterized protein n=1 Tax=Strongylus vulgaris TaxID=40348 RepID=A0A3P7INI4_STRVU|nr:unnamed protein product [Strongylus vulgaris]